MSLNNWPKSHKSATQTARRRPQRRKARQSRRLLAEQLESRMLLASLHTIDWDTDGSADGSATGTLAGAPVTVTSTDGPHNGGVLLGGGAADWDTSLATNDVPGISDTTVVKEATAIDWNAAAAGTVTVDFGGHSVTDPILLFIYTDAAVETFDFDDGLTLNLIDQNPAGTTIEPGNVVTTAGGHSNTADDGFAVQLTGTFTSITFATNVNNAVSESVGFTVAVEADLYTIDWDTDSSADGSATGTLAGAPVTVTSTDGPHNGGVLLGGGAADWDTSLATNDVPGISDTTVVKEATAIDWNAAAAGTVTVDFGGHGVTDPILLFIYTDAAVETFDFDDGLTLNLIDQNPAGTTIEPGNVVTTAGGHSNTADDGFAVQLTGTFTSITFATNVNNAVSESVGFTVAAKIVSVDVLPGIDEQYYLHTTGNDFFNYGGLNERWLRGIQNQFGNPWYFVTPAGELFAWDGTANSATGQLLAGVGTAVYNDLSLLYNAFSLATPEEADEMFMLFQGNNTFLNYGGLNEKWVQGIQHALGNVWYFITPNGDFYKWAGFQNQAVGDRIGSFGPAVYDDLSLLVGADGPTADPAQLDQQLTLHTIGNDFQNYGGQNERWVRGDVNSFGNRWYFVTPAGGFFEWDGTPNQATGNQLDLLDPSVYTDLSQLYEAYQPTPTADQLARAAALSDERDLMPGGDDFLNYGGQGERWIPGAENDFENNWYFITPGGDFYQWDGAPNQATGTLLDTFSQTFYDDLSLFAQGGANLLASGYGNAAADPLTTDQLDGIVQAAVGEWVAAGIPHASADLLSQATVTVTDLPGNRLGMALEGAGIIAIDTDAAGHGWFVDATPWNDDEFDSGAPHSALDPQRHMDLLTVVLHEMGHLLGAEDIASEDHSDDVMSAVLEPGERRLPHAWAADVDQVFAELGE